MIAVRKVEERQPAARNSSVAEAQARPQLRVHDFWLAPRDRIELTEASAYELITYVVSGEIAYEVGSHTTALIWPGEFHRAVVGLGHEPAHAQTNPSRSEASHVVQFRMLEPRVALTGPQEQRRFSFALRRGLLCAVAAPSGDPTMLALQNQITLYSAVLEPGQHIVHGFEAARGGVLHVVSGELSVDSYILGPGDVAHVRGERSLAFTARAHAEVLLCDVPEANQFDG